MGFEFSNSYVVILSEVRVVVTWNDEKREALNFAEVPRVE
jgi:hypothetical protein